MKCTIVVDPTKDEEVIIYTKGNTGLANEIRLLCEQESTVLMGYQEREATRLSPHDVCCFIVENNHVIAICDTERFRIKKRLYELETCLPDNFVKINQSCIANFQKIKKFDAALAGTLRVVFTNGYIDFVSRRQIKYVKERLGLL